MELALFAAADVVLYQQRFILFDQVLDRGLEVLYLLAGLRMCRQVRSDLLVVRSG